MKLNNEIFRFSPSASDRMTLGDCCEGIVVFGESGSGKTSSMKTVARAFLKSGMGGVVLCVKPDEFDFWKVLAAETGREKDLVNFAPSLECFNFISHEASQYQEVPIENLVSILLDAANVLDGKSKDDFWNKAARALLRSLLTVIYCAKGEVQVETLYNCMASMPRNVNDSPLEEWKKTSPLFSLLQERQRTHPDLETSIAYIMKEWSQLDPKQTSSIQVTLSTLLDVLRRSPLKDLLCSKTSVTPEDCREGKIIVLNIPVKTMGDAGRVAQIIFKAAAQRTFERKPGRFVFIWADECQYVAAPGDTLFNSTARSSQCATVYMTQNLPLWFEQAGHDSKNRIMALLGNLATKLFFLNGDKETNQFAADLIDKAIVKRRSGGTSSGQSTSTSRGYSETLDYLVQPSEFKTLRKGREQYNFTVEGIVYKTGRKWSNGKRFKKFLFDQKIGEPSRVPSPTWLKVSVALIVAALLLGAQLLGLLPAFPDLLSEPHIQAPKMAAMVHVIWPYTHSLFPLLALILTWIVAMLFDPPPFAQDNPCVPPAKPDERPPLTQLKPTFP